MINPLDELSDIYLGQISEADNSPEAIKARVMQHVRAIRYRARKEGDQLNKACLLYTSPSPRDRQKSRMPSSA